MAVDLHHTIIVRDRNGEDFLVKLFFALYSFIELDNASYGNYHAISVLSVCDIKYYSTAVYLAHEERGVHLVGCHEKGGFIYVDSSKCR